MPRRAAWTLALAILYGPATDICAQATEPSANSVATRTELEDRLRECLTDSTNTSALREKLDRYRVALGTRGETVVIVVMLDALRNCPPEGKPTLEGRRITELLDRVSFHRRRGHPERMLPALEVLSDLMPNDARVLYALGEAYGVQSVVFDAHKAEAAFGRLYEQLLTEPERPKTPTAKGSELAKFLPELAGPTDRTAWLRDRVRGFCETLRDNQPIGLWKLRDPRLDELQEDLRVVLPRGNQRELVDVLAQMQAIYPDDPASCYMLAQVLASLGPLFQPDRSIELFRQFLDLTAEERFQKQADEDPLMSRTDVATRLSALLAVDAKDQLQALRIAAKGTLIDLQPAKGKATPMLFFPDFAALQTRTRELQKQMEKDNDELAKLTDRIEKVKSELESAKADYERWKQQSAGRRRGIADPQPFVDAISSRRQLIQQLEKRIEPLQARTAEQQQWLDACTTRLEQFGR